MLTVIMIKCAPRSCLNWKTLVAWFLYRWTWKRNVTSCPPTLVESTGIFCLAFKGTSESTECNFRNFHPILYRLHAKLQLLLQDKHTCASGLVVKSAMNIVPTKWSFIHGFVIHVNSIQETFPAVISTSHIFSLYINFWIYILKKYSIAMQAGYKPQFKDLK